MHVTELHFHFDISEILFEMSEEQEINRLSQKKPPTRVLKFSKLDFYLLENLLTQTEQIVFYLVC